jgi:TonB-linked SusC/RagA family outer membrane protein
MQMKKSILFILGLICAFSSIYAQVTNNTSNVITGKVLSSTHGEPLPAATIKVKNTNSGTTTDAQGRFSIGDVNKNTVLVISSIGYTPQEITIGSKTKLTIRLKPSLNTLDETVIMGYGTTTKRLNTGNISTITAKEISEQPVTNVLAALSGRAPGVYVQTQNGLPGGGISIQIRGLNSIGAGTDPLYIIDGVPYPSTPLNINNNGVSGANGYTSPLNSINPDDIQSIEILKDADATAIYGSKGSNGVVLITTKKGKPGKTRVNINVSEGFSYLNQQGRYLNLEQYLQLRREAFKNDGIAPTAVTAPDLLAWDTTRATDWQKYLLGNTDPITNVQASLSGGDAQTSFLLSGNFRKEGSIYGGNFNYMRAGAHFNMEHSSSDKKVHTAFTVSYTADDNNLPKENLLSSLSLSPNFPLFNQAGDLNWNGGHNPLGILKQLNNARTDNLVSHLTLRYGILRGLDIKVSLGYNKLTMAQTTVTPKDAQGPSAYAENSAYFGDMSVESSIIEPQINYVKEVSKGDLTLLLGGTWQNTVNQSSYIKGTNYSNEKLMGTLSGAGSIGSPINHYSDYKYLSVFTRINYNWENKYIINGSFRRDGSSRFGPGNRYGNFGAIGAAWLFSKESFIKNHLAFISYAKLRSSYGITGNDQIADYQYLATYTTGRVPYGDVTTLQPARAANPDYGWETNKKLEAAIELGFLKDKILLTTAWYYNRSSNELVSYPLPTLTGFPSYQANFPALVGNTGWEFEFKSSNINSGHFNWHTSFNITFSKNKLVSFPGIESSSYAYLYQVGKSLSAKKGYRYIGVNSKTGIAQFKDINHDGMINNADRVVIGKTAPDFYGGLNNAFSYKGIDLSFFFQFAKLKNSTPFEAMTGINSHLNIVLNRWQNPGDITGIQKATSTPGSPASATSFNILFSSADFSDASYIRFKDISLAYRLNPHWLKSIKAESCRIYLEAENLVTWAANSHYRLDPETAAGSVPPLRTYVLGLQVAF